MISRCFSADGHAARYDLYRYWRELNGSADQALVGGVEQQCRNIANRVRDAFARFFAACVSSSRAAAISPEGFPLSVLDVADSDSYDAEENSNLCCVCIGS